VSLFLNDVPTFRSLALLPYWLGPAQEGIGLTAAAAESYKAFLALRPDADPPDALAADARRRVAP
jgi:hypothetical protein